MIVAVLGCQSRLISDRLIADTSVLVEGKSKYRARSTHRAILKPDNKQKLHSGPAVSKKDLFIFGLEDVAHLGVITHVNRRESQPVFNVSTGTSPKQSCHDLL